MFVPVPGNPDMFKDNSSVSEENFLDVVPVPGNPDMFKDIMHGFILKMRVDGSIVALAVEEQGERRSLTTDEKKKAQSLGLKLQ